MLFQRHNFYPNLEQGLSRLKGWRQTRNVNLLPFRAREAKLSANPSNLPIRASAIKASAPSDRTPGTVTVNVNPAHPVNTFFPNQAFGAALDGLEKGDIARLYTPQNIAQMKTTGLSSISYRLRTELGVETWHWNDKGTWSDPQHQQGYWTSSDQSNTSLLVSNGYKLPRRGNTFDQAENNGYSRIDDRDPASFWKSNPYLNQYYTGESNTLHPQWILVDLGKRQKVDAAKILWGTPYATRYQIEYWDGVDPIYVSENPPGNWHPFANGRVASGQGGDALIRFAAKPVAVRYLRILMSQSSETAPPDSKDIRDGLGYAMRELYLGTLDNKGQFHDVIQHGQRNDRQTVIYTSSTDPWHRAVDKDANVEQPGIDRVFQSGLTNNLPAMMPVGLLYDTPENTAAEIRFLKARGYPIQQIEMGEEPDGQYVIPEDYAALYEQRAKVIRQVNPLLKLGGPGFQTATNGWRTWPDATGNRSWMNRFLNHLRSHNQFADFNFFSFEWYPFTNGSLANAPQLAKAPSILAKGLKLLRQDGVPKTIPWIITEYGYSPFAAQVEVEMPSALLNDEIVGQFLTLGGNTAYLYGYEPNTPIHEIEGGNTWGNLMIFEADEQGRIRYRMPTYYGARLLTQDWAQPGDRLHQVYSAASNIHNRRGQSLVTAYAVYRPDHQWAILLINKDPKQNWSVNIRFRNSQTHTVSLMQNKLDVFQYSSKQYTWHPQGENGYPIVDKPPQHFTLQRNNHSPLTLPAYSLTVVRGRGPIEPSL